MRITKSLEFTWDEDRVVAGAVAAGGGGGVFFQNMESKKWRIKCSESASRAVNPIRQIVDGMRVQPNADKEVIKLSLGDPTVFGNLPYPEHVNQSLQTVLESSFLDGANCAGYNAAHGVASARQAVASTHLDVDPDDVCITSGCSQALQFAVTVLCDRGDVVLLPRPGFSVYETICSHAGIDVSYYNLIASKSWEVDLNHLEGLITPKVRAILVNNPSNPCGSVYSKKHLLDIIGIARKHGLPLISDEVYEHMVFSGESFHPLAALSDDVPVLTCGGLAKRYLMPGWRVGWLILNDRNDILRNSGVFEGVRNLSQVIIGANTLVQFIVPKLLLETKADFYASTLRTLESNASFLFEHLSTIEGIEPVKPQGAMYMMVRVNTDMLAFENDVDFAEKLFSSQSVFVLPGQCFNYPNFLRLTVLPPHDKLEEACDRIAAFCQANRRQASKKRTRDASEERKQ